MIVRTPANSVHASFFTASGSYYDICTSQCFWDNSHWTRSYQGPSNNLSVASLISSAGTCPVVFTQLAIHCLYPWENKTVPVGFQYCPERDYLTEFQGLGSLERWKRIFFPCCPLLLNLLMLFSLVILIHTSTIPTHKKPVYYLNQFQT